MKLKRKNVSKKENCLNYYGEGGSPYTPYTPAYRGGGAVIVNLSDVFPGTGLDGVYSPSNWKKAWTAFQTELKCLYGAMSDAVHSAYGTAKNWFKSFFGL